jgi:hypothetical protein
VAGHGLLLSSLLSIVSFMLALNLGLEILAIHPNPEEILLHQQASSGPEKSNRPSFSAMGTGGVP